MGGEGKWSGSRERCDQILHKLFREEVAACSGGCRWGRLSSNDLCLPPTSTPQVEEWCPSPRLLHADTARRMGEQSHLRFKIGGIENTAPADVCDIQPLGSAGPLEMAARARSASLGRSKWSPETAWLCCDARNGRSNSLGSAMTLEIARPGCSKTQRLLRHAQGKFIS